MPARRDVFGAVEKTLTQNPKVCLTCRHANVIGGTETMPEVMCSKNFWHTAHTLSEVYWKRDQDTKQGQYCASWDGE